MASARNHSSFKAAKYRASAPETRANYYNMADEQQSTPVMYYNDSRRYNRIQARNHLSGNQYEEVSEVNFGALEMNPYDELERKPQVKPLQFNNGYIPPFKGSPVDAFPPSPKFPSRDNSKRKSTCARWSKSILLLVVVLLISSSSLALNVLIIKGIIPTPYACKKDNSTLARIKPILVEALRGEDGGAMRELIISIIKNITLQTLDNEYKGPKGPQGAQGELGDRGPRGLTGPKGQTGPQGPPGPKGAQGSQGLQGLQGAPGTNGSKGERGLQGIRGKPGYNGSRGEPGIPGGPAATNFSACIYKYIEGKSASGKNADYKGQRIKENKGRKFIGVMCTTNAAAIVELKTELNHITKTSRDFWCHCVGSVNSSSIINTNKFPSMMDCRIHYWDCPSL